MALKHKPGAVLVILKAAVLTLIIFQSAAAASPVQQPGEQPRLTYDVVSVRPVQRNPAEAFIVGASFGDIHSGNVTLRNVTLQQLLVLAFGLSDRQIVGIPEAFAHEFYLVEARSEEETNLTLQRMNDADALKAQQTMLQTVLKERFSLNSHSEVRDISAFFLGPGKTVRLKPTTAPEEERTPDFEPAMPALGVTCGSHDCQIPVRGQSTKWLASMLSAQLHAPVEDHTNLTGRYDFTLFWSRPNLVSADDASEFP